MVCDGGSALLAALSSTACPAKGVAGVKVMRGSTPPSAAFTAAPASSMPAPQVLVVQ